MKTKTHSILLFTGFAILLFGCKVPRATVTASKLNKSVPKTFYSTDSDSMGGNIGIIPWKQFFTDPDLTVLIDTALKNNQELMITLQEIEIAKSNVTAAKGKLSPTVTAGGGIGLRKAGRYTSEGAGDASTEMKPGMRIPDPLPNFQVGLQTDWEVDIWHKLRTEKESAIAHYLSTVEGKNFVLSSLIAEIANDYYELLALDNQLDIIQQYIQLQQQALEISKIQKQAAAATELAVKKFEAELAKAKGAEYEVRQSVTEKENEINGLLGRFPQPIVRNKTAFITMVPRTIYTGIPSELLSNRPDIKAAELELKSVKLDVQAARKEFYPSLNISIMLGLEAFNPTYLMKLPESIVSNIVGDMVGPLINKSAIQAKFKAADARQIQALYEYDKTILNAYLCVSNLVMKIKNMGDYYRFKADQSKALDASVPIADQLFKNSRIDYLEVLMNQRDILDAKMELLEAKEKQLAAVVDIYINLGGGWR